MDRVLHKPNSSVQEQADGTAVHQVNASPLVKATEPRFKINVQLSVQNNHTDTI
jgi:hypothetical protein